MLISVIVAPLFFLFCAIVRRLYQVSAPTLAMYLCETEFAAHLFFFLLLCARAFLMCPTLAAHHTDPVAVFSSHYAAATRLQLHPFYGMGVMRELFCAVFSIVLFATTSSIYTSLVAVFI